ncbi:methyl-accepting chemotaxis protein [Clostridium algidicarnis]|uniref:methyl-accepting chemotaxis protein n=1 Tax=Clostridium algidicarnis TaxID=37659 RepID=UPI001C0DB81C|nr:hypothetical protein [Clostridium algidicarnis]MBU3213137.1 hypothetical protein [Clostridium algidicarnis]MBU3223192.1 hypothetical protein [Clostridium algidicarnis]
MITSISDHTNLLALNVLIGVVRVGEHGQVLSIVAMEVKKYLSRWQQPQKESYILYKI